MPATLIAAKCSGESRRASMPACSLGCRVFTRPSSISGKPVCSATSVTGRLCSARSFAVPPVDRILILNRARPRANSARPLLSDTLISAVRMGIMRVGGERLDHRSHLYFQRLDLLSQSIAVDPEHLRGDGLISLGPIENELDQRTQSAISFVCLIPPSLPTPTRAYGFRRRHSPRFMPPAPPHSAGADSRARTARRND